MQTWGDGYKSKVHVCWFNVEWTDGTTHRFSIRFDLDREDPVTIATDRVRSGGFTSIRNGDNVLFGTVKSISLDQATVPQFIRGRMPE